MNIFEAIQISNQSKGYVNYKTQPGETILLTFKMQREESGLYAPAVAVQRVFNLNPKDLGMPDKIFLIEAQEGIDYDNKGKAIKTSPFNQLAQFSKAHLELALEGEKQKIHKTSGDNKTRDEATSKITKEYEEKRPFISSLKTNIIAVATGGSLSAPGSEILKDTESICNYVMVLGTKFLNHISKFTQMFNELKHVKESKEPELPMFVEVHYPKKLGASDVQQKMYAGKEVQLVLRECTFQSLETSSPKESIEKYNNLYNSLVTNEDDIAAKKTAEKDVNPDLIKAYLGKVLLNTKDLYSNAFEYNPENKSKLAESITLLTEIQSVSSYKTLTSDLDLGDSIIELNSNAKVDLADEITKIDMDQAVDEILGNAPVDMSTVPTEEELAIGEEDEDEEGDSL